MPPHSESDAYQLQSDALPAQLPRVGQPEIIGRATPNRRPPRLNTTLNVQLTNPLHRTTQNRVAWTIRQASKALQCAACSHTRTVICVAQYVMFGGPCRTLLEHELGLSNRRC